MCFFVSDCLAGYSTFKAENYALCRNLTFWASFLDMMAENRYNVITLWALHPWPCVEWTHDASLTFSALSLSLSLSVCVCVCFCSIGAKDPARVVTSGFSVHAFALTWLPTLQIYGDAHELSESRFVRRHVSLGRTGG